MPELTLYSTLGCHLCEQAEALVAPVLQQRAGALVVVDIADDDRLMESYGVRIPVLRDQHTGKELGWPFDQEQLDAWLQNLGRL